jgi:hypothetical protein
MLSTGNSRSIDVAGIPLSRLRWHIQRTAHPEDLMFKLSMVFTIALLAAGCMTQGEQLTGSEMTTGANDRSQFVTYVSMEEFQRMTPEERDRLNATVGTSSTLIPSREKSSKRVSEEDLQELYPKSK